MRGGKTPTQGLADDSSRQNHPPPPFAGPCLTPFLIGSAARTASSFCLASRIPRRSSSTCTHKVREAHRRQSAAGAAGVAAAGKAAAGTRSCCSIASTSCQWVATAASRLTPGGWACVVQTANMVRQLAGGNSSWCPELQSRTAHLLNRGGPLRCVEPPAAPTPGSAAPLQCNRSPR